MRKNQLPEEADEFNDFLERFQCRRVVNNENLSKVILEIAKQELVQKPHIMIASRAIEAVPPIPNYFRH